MYIPQENDIVKYIIYSNSKEIDVLYLNDIFYLSIGDMGTLFTRTKDEMINLINQTFSDEKLRIDSQLCKPSSSIETYYHLDAVIEIGEQINPTETKRFADWANSTLSKYEIQQQSNSRFKGVYSSTKDFWDEVEMYMEMDTEEGISMEVLTRYLKRVRASYNSFIDKLEEIEDINYILISDLNYLDSIELRYIDRKLHDSVYKEFGKDIEKTIYIATLSELMSKLINYMGDWYNVPWSDKIDSLKIKIIQIDVECKQMFYLMERFSYFSQRLFQNYEDIVNPSYISHFEEEFNFWDVRADADLVADLDERRKLYVQARIDATKWLIDESTDTDKKTHCEKYIEKCQQSIDLIDYEKSQQKNDNSLQNKKSKKNKETYTIKLAKTKKTDFIKILSAMYDARLFVDEDGKPLTNKQKLMDEFGQFLNDDFSAYSASLSQAKTRDEKTFLKPFREIEKEALRYFNAVGEE